MVHPFTDLGCMTTTQDERSEATGPTFREVAESLRHEPSDEPGTGGAKSRGHHLGQQGIGAGVVAGPPRQVRCREPPRSIPPSDAPQRSADFGVWDKTEGLDVRPGALRLSTRARADRVQLEALRSALVGLTILRARRPSTRRPLGIG
jgi:hypothetical protein